MSESEKKANQKQVKSPEFLKETKRDIRRYYNLFGTFSGYSL